MKTAGEGLAHHHCRRHVEQRQHYRRPSLKASELRPLITAATAYVCLLAANYKFIAATITDMRQTLEKAGPAEIAIRQRRVREKAGHDRTGEASR